MAVTPAMKQFFQAKEKYPDCVILFRMGDFYETFYEDAKTAARELGITLTQRGKTAKIPLAGIPYHALNNYLHKLVNKGYKVAICEQLEDPKFAKGIVKRGVVRVVTPGTVLEDTMLKEADNNYIMSVYKDKKIGIAVSDISTGSFFILEIEEEELLDEISRISPSEIISNIKLKTEVFQTQYDERFYFHETAYKRLTEHFSTISLEGFGIQGMEHAISAAGALLSYLKETKMDELKNITKIRRQERKKHMILDKATLRNLEITHNIMDSSSKATLLSTVDKTLTPMGKRLLKNHLVQPLIDAKKIRERHDAVEELTNDVIAREELRISLSDMLDIERLISRITTGSANARDLIALKNSLTHIPRVKEAIKNTSSSLMQDIKNIPESTHIIDLIELSIKEEPSNLLNEGNIIKKGYNKDLDELHDIKQSGKKWIATLGTQEKQKTGIKSLKIKFNNVFGYFIEVTKPNLHLVPKDYTRKQTQANSERFITEELKDKESLILNAEEKIVKLEQTIFKEIITQISRDVIIIQETSEKIALLDVLLSNAVVAIRNNYCRPDMLDSESILIIEDGRHPVVEKLDTFIPNNTCFNENTLIKLITGPNMAGKSTYLRQVALIVLLAQIGSFVPARSASISIVDRIFTRVGAHDDLASGQSTFMIEMNETANILNNATSRSLIILDEIGRGTSTYDGVSIAWAVVEYIYKKIRANTLFATHYHVLNKLEKELEKIRNYNIAVKETDDSIIFLRKIILGGTDKSYGVQVAKLAGLPKDVIQRSMEIMDTLEKQDTMKKKIQADKEKLKQMKLL